MTELTERNSDKNMADNGGRRKGSDRRQYEYTIHIPERRKILDRRESDERRQDQKPMDE